jgi:amino acid adenylation domain-containing protein
MIIKENQKSLSQQKVVSSQLYKEEEYWMNKLAGEWIRSCFPYDMNKNQDISRMELAEFTLTGDIFSQLMKLSNGSDYRLHMIIVAGLLVLINKYTGIKDIILGTPTLKQDFEAEFINTALALRNQINSDDITFKELLLQVRQTVTESNENQNYPIEQLPLQLGLSYSQGDDFPLFDIIILLENIQDKKYIQHIYTNMIFSFRRTDEVVEGTIEYNTLLYHKSTIERLTSHFSHLLGQVLANGSAKIIDIDILTQEERNQLLFDFNNTIADYPMNKTIHRLFTEQVEKEPDNPAVVDCNGIDAISYRELNERSNRFARLLRSKGVTKERIVGIMVERSLHMIVGMLGIIKAGGAYLPTDTSYPEKRIQYILADSGVEILITQKEMTGTFGEQGVIKPDDKDISSFEKYNLENVSYPENLIYVIYTSGSTGNPKGVLVQHRGVVNMALFYKKLFGVNHESRMSQVASPGFDAMANEVWPCLINGAALYIAPDETRVDPVKQKKWLLDNKITISYQPTVIAEHLLEEEWPEEDVFLRTIATAGDRLTRYPLGHPFALYNLYGPTEDTVWTSWSKVEERNTDSSPQQKHPHIGKPIENHQVYILSMDFKLQPIGVLGEICIGGDGLARGYLNQPELTAEKFISPNTLQRLPFTRLYRTGDLARLLPEGIIEFSGRMDHQVKIRGYRIELEEIERQLLKHHEIKKAVVIARETRRHGGVNDFKFLCAYIVANKALEASELREYLLKTLPDYMIPLYFVHISQIPLTPNGKVDRKKLPEPEIQLSTKYEAPSTDIEKLVANTWNEVLKLDKVGLNDNFFAIGGNSLNVIQLNSKLNQLLKVEIPVVAMFENFTISSFVGYLNRMNRTGEGEGIPAEDMNMDRSDLHHKGKLKKTLQKSKRKGVRQYV